MPRYRFFDALGTVAQQLDSDNIGQLGVGEYRIIVP